MDTTENKVKEHEATLIDRDVVPGSNSEVSQTPAQKNDFMARESFGTLYASLIGNVIEHAHHYPAVPHAAPCRMDGTLLDGPTRLEADMKCMLYRDWCPVFISGVEMKDLGIQAYCDCEPVISFNRELSNGNVKIDILYNLTDTTFPYLYPEVYARLMSEARQSIKTVSSDVLLSAVNDAIYEYCRKGVLSRTDLAYPLITKLAYLGVLSKYYNNRIDIARSIRSQQDLAVFTGDEIYRGVRMAAEITDNVYESIKGRSNSQSVVMALAGTDVLSMIDESTRKKEQVRQTEEVGRERSFGRGRH